MPIKADNNIFENSIRLSWVKQYMLDQSLKQLDDKMVNLMISFINNINNEKSPTNKLREFENIYFIVSNIITLYGYNKNMLINLLVYIFIRSKPNYLYSSLRYIEIFWMTDIKEEIEKKDFLVSKIKEVISKIISFSEKDVNLTKKQFDDNCSKVFK